MKKINTLALANLIIKSKSVKKTRSKNIDYLLSALAISALASQAQASNKSYEVNVRDLATEAGVKVSDIAKVELKITGDLGEVVSLGDGVFN